MANTHRRRTALLAGPVTALALLTACGGADGAAATTSSTPPGSSAPAASESVPSATPSVPPSAGPTTTAPSARPASNARCHTSELEAVLGRNDPGAGQENFPVVLTNTSSRTCTLHGYPGAAFVDAQGRQLGPDPLRTPGAEVVTVTLAPGDNAWSGITFANPEISGARTAVPDALLVTPPDERDPLKVSWSAGEVPVSGDEPSVRLTPFGAGPGG
ncbi:DUF4232 domain-containing protein [Streptomyces sp. NPDC090106]|uniref:DUF4232 domain-containing protein n=1 Tax=Streptomyces sp. NPDC090106 TaxID=3365946 RepID=UPI0037F528D8